MAVTGEEPPDIQDVRKTLPAQGREPIDSWRPFDDHQFEFSRFRGEHAARSVFGEAVCRLSEQAPNGGPSAACRLRRATFRDGCRPGRYSPESGPAPAAWERAPVGAAGPSSDQWPKPESGWCPSGCGPRTITPLLISSRGKTMPRRTGAGSWIRFLLWPVIVLIGVVGAYAVAAPLLEIGGVAVPARELPRVRQIPQGWDADVTFNVPPPEPGDKDHAPRLVHGPRTAGLDPIARGAVR